MAKKQGEEAGARLGWTETLRDGKQPAIRLATREAITSLRFAGTDRPPLLLPSSQRRFSIGAGACDLVIPRDVSKNVSGYHASLERVGSALLVVDQESKNGSYRSHHENRLATFQVQAGESCWLADVQLLAMDTHLDVLRPRLAWCLGLDDHAAIDGAIETIAAGGPLALVGPAGSDAARLACAIHDASTRRQNFFLPVVATPLPSLDHANGGTAFVDLDRIAKVPASYVAALLDDLRGVRPIFAASSERVLREHLDDHAHRLRRVSLVPLAKRRAEVVRLLALHWIGELHTGRHVEELGPAVAALAQHDWPRGVEELREQSPRLLAYLEHGGVRPAAEALGITHQTLGAHFKRIGFAVRDARRR